MGLDALKLVVAGALVMVTVAIHAVGFSLLLRAMVRSHALALSGFRPITALVTGLACWLVLIHSVEIFVWGLFYLWQGCMPDAESALYFSGVTYTTLGYGDHLLPRAWRILAPLEALTGILMCGASAGLFFAVVSRFMGRWMQSQPAGG
jgi:hypothetical protein